MTTYEDENYWKQRAQRAEAECERLRDEVGRLRFALRWLHDASQMAADTAITQDAELPRARKNAGKTLAAPPPEGEPETPPNHTEIDDLVAGYERDPEKREALREGRERVREMFDAPHTPEQTGGRMIDTESIDERYAQFERRGQPDRHPTLEFGSVALERFIHDMMGEIKRLRGLQSNRVPEQARGDALAALEELQQFIVEGEEGQFDTIRKALTASGVPYETDQAIKHALFLIRHGESPPEVTRDDTIHRLERALASAPAVPRSTDVTCECGRGPREVFAVQDDAGYTEWKLATHCTECLEPSSTDTNGQ